MKAKKIWLVLVLALILRLILLNGSFWLDEAAQILESSRPLSQQLMIREDFQPPLMHIITFLGRRGIILLGLPQTEALFRLLPSLIPGLVTIWGTYQIALLFFEKERNKEKIALLAAFLLSISSFHIFYSQELRPYSLPAMWATLATIELLKIKEFNARRRFAIFSILGLYSSYLYPFFLVAQFLYLTFNSEFKKEKFKSLFILALPMVLAFLPWLPKFYEQLTTGQTLRLSMPGWDQVVSIPQLKSLVLVPLKFIFGVLNIEASAFYLLTLIMIGGGLILTLRKIKKKERHFFGFFLLLPLILAWLVSFVVPVIRPKRLLYLMPYFVILFSWACFKLKEEQKKLANIFIATLLTVNIISTTAYYSKLELQRENWRGLVGEMEDKFGLPKHKSLAVFAFDAPFAPWRYYETGRINDLATGTFYLPAIENPEEKFKMMANYDYVLIFDYLRDLTDPDDQLTSIARDLGFTEIGALDYPNIGPVRIYQNGKNLAYENWH